MTYEVIVQPQARNDILQHQRAGRKKLLFKINVLINELREHPRTGIGKPERLKYDMNEYWSRRIDSKHRLVYRIEEQVATVTVISAAGHYENK